MLHSQRSAAVSKTRRKSETVAIADRTMARREARALLEQIIRLRAYELYLARGHARGDATQDWLQAEREYLGLDTLDGPLPIAPSRRGHDNSAGA